MEYSNSVIELGPSPRKMADFSSLPKLFRRNTVSNTIIESQDNYFSRLIIQFQEYVSGSKSNFLQNIQTLSLKAAPVTEKWPMAHGYLDEKKSPEEPFFHVSYIALHLQLYSCKMLDSALYPDLYFLSKN